LSCYDTDSFFDIQNHYDEDEYDWGEYKDQYGSFTEEIEGTDAANKTG
jgi:hypothetical protein